MRVKACWFGYVHVFFFLFAVLNAYAAPPPESKENTDEKSTEKKKEPRHFIKTCVWENTFFSPQRKVKSDPKLAIDMAESSVGFYTPFLTKTSWNDSLKVLKTNTFLLTGNASRLRFVAPFSPQERHLYRYGLGFRFIHSDGDKEAWVLSINPFSAGETSTNFGFNLRISTLLVYNRTIRDNFSLRLGVWRTFMWGSKEVLPVIGFRLGKLDGINWSVQFPRSMTLDVPLNRIFAMQLFMRPQGSVYAFANDDLNNLDKPPTVFLGRRDFCSGVQVNSMPFRNVSLFVAAGIVDGRIERRIENRGRRRAQRNHENFATVNLESSLFVQFGVNILFGKSKYVAGNKSMYEVIDLNNVYGNDDGNAIINNVQIPGSKDSLSKTKLQWNDISDLVTENDL